MAAALTLSQQIDALIARIKGQVPGLQSVVGMEDLEEAMKTDELLPAAVVIFSGDYPEKHGPGETEYSGQKIFRYWSIVLVMELIKTPGESFDLLEPIETACVGWRMCRGMQFMTTAGKRFVAKSDTRVVYEVRLKVMTTITI